MRENRIFKSEGVTVFFHVYWEEIETPADEKPEFKEIDEIFIDEIRILDDEYIVEISDQSFREVQDLEKLILENLNDTEIKY